MTNKSKEFDYEAYLTHDYKQLFEQCKNSNVDIVERGIRMVLEGLGFGSSLRDGLRQTPNFVLDIEGGEKLLFNCTNDNLKQMGTLIVEAHINVLGRDTVNQLIKHLESGFNEIQYHDLGNHTAYIVAKNRETTA